MRRNYKKFGFTLMELLVVIAVIALLMGILTPALNNVRVKAKETKQKAQLHSIETGLEAFRIDEGDYPRSDVTTGQTWGNAYTGAQKLAEAMVGLDLMGFNPNTDWHADMRPSPPIGAPPHLWKYNTSTYDYRKDAYLELENANAFMLLSPSIPLIPGQQGGLGMIPSATPNFMPENTYVLCDVFKATKVNVGGKQVNAGTPILYYKANVNYKFNFADPFQLASSVYNFLDNGAITSANVIKTGKPDHFYDADAFPNGVGQVAALTIFYNAIANPKVLPISNTQNTPYKRDSFILISAGYDGLYGTNDDITNFD